MDNFTLLITLNILLFLIMFFTSYISLVNKHKGLSKWRSSSILVFTGFFLLLTQRFFPPLISVILANFLILAGTWYQVESSLIIELNRGMGNRKIPAVLCVIYFSAFLFFTYIQFSTPARIIVISLLLMASYSVYLFQKTDRRENRLLSFLYVSGILFYIFRVVLTVSGFGKVRSLTDRNLATTISFIFVLYYSLFYLIAMFQAYISSKNRQIIFQKEKLNYLFEFLGDTVSHLELNQLYKAIEGVLRKSMGVDTAALYLIDDDKQGHTMVHVFNEMDLPIEEVTHFARGEGISGKAIEEDRVVETDMNSYPIKSVAEDFLRKGAETLVSAPLKSSEGIIGAISIVYPETLKTGALDVSFFYHLGEQIGLVLQNAMLYEKITYFANTDALTGLMNRRKMQETFQKEIKRAERTGQNFSLAMIDLDHFKTINDTYGHDFGDEILKTAAHIFTSVCRETDYICRWGGEEFLILLVDTDLNASVNTGERIRKEFQNFDYPGLRTQPTLSMGLTGFSLDLSMEGMIKKADEALYEAKKAGRNRLILN